METTVAKERPILFSTPMVTAILEGRKTQTRRVLKPQTVEKHDPVKRITHEPWPMALEGPEWYTPGVVDRWGELQPADKQVYGVYTWDGEHGWPCLYGAPGDVLYVREAWCVEYWKDELSPNEIPSRAVWYKADRPSPVVWPLGRWRASIHMPRWASRIKLEITEVRVERLQGISENDAIAEGWHGEAGDGLSTGHLPTTAVKAIGRSTPKRWFANCWQQINASRGYSWEANPWVWVVAFKKMGGTP